ncbi:Coenzyme PQQ synthesis protein D (PqqD) [Paenibacillus algorifonticola]|uniref:Coenzyme PQQ synthesis protein D (PqqD) n=1 Tax=Paenibacillus algorifonticola TaxID=684063 RepID=A0A1I2GHS2_9BACL|nr:lasso peptide biosynthesis PqqD family chaperone [Paenibacillus algorifonticola]SFF16540.1 Coenzyme PQQ synthesis protein D (PqqD) [Paenibacillus algorifonticola]
MSKHARPLLQPEQIIQRTEGHLATDMDGDKVLLSLSSGKYYNMGKLGGIIWERTASPVTRRDIVTQLLKEYEVEPAACDQQVADFLQDLYAEGLLEPVSNAGVRDGGAGDTAG